MPHFNPDIIEPTDFNIMVAPVTGRTRIVEIIYNGSGIHRITGPVPIMTINKTFERNGAGTIELIKSAINLTGKIIRNGAESDSDIDPPGTGLPSILGAISNLERLFKSQDFGNLDIKCAGATAPLPSPYILSMTGVRLVSFNTSPTPDNWTFTADYTIDLEHYSTVNSASDPLVRGTSDTWSIEPLEEYIYSSFSTNVITKPEYDNPKLLPTAPSQGNTVPAGFVGPGGGAPIALSTYNIPQFKISRKLSAAGIPNAASMGYLAPNTTRNPAISGLGNRAYLEAKRWVESRLDTGFMGTTNNSAAGYVNSGLGYITNTRAATNPVLSIFDHTHLYNHLRTVNFSITDGTYEVNETWLAMPTGIGYTEDYTIESSTDEKYMKTVRVQGSIKGLSLVSMAVLTGDPLYMNPSNDGKINLSGSLQQFPQSPFYSAPKILDNITSNSTNTTLHSNKYHNANSGWINDIKPYLYRRAHLVMNSIDRTKKYINPATYGNNQNEFPNNPTYCNEALLNIVPISTSEAHDPKKGTIAYTCEYTNKFNIISGTISESITISETNPVDVVSESFVLGRRLGPVLQSLGARTSSRKAIAIEVTVIAPTSLGGFLMTSTECPLYTGGPVFSAINTIIEGLKPYGDRPDASQGGLFGNFDRRTGNRVGNQGQVFVTENNISWNPTEGRFSRSVGWLYQPCTNTRPNLDN